MRGICELIHCSLNIVLLQCSPGEQCSVRHQNSSRAGIELWWAGCSPATRATRAEARSHIHSFLSLRDAARAACVSHTFRRSWKYHPNLTFKKKTLGLDGNPYREKKTSDEISSDLVRKIDHILKNHSGIGVKTLRLEKIGRASCRERV